MENTFDVIICGSGSAGLCAATWLARYGLRCKILEKRAGPLEIGQADGVQCRTVEIYESFGIVEELLRESYHVLEFAFWVAGDDEGLKLKSRVADTPQGLTHLPHVILNQARMNGLLIEAMYRFNKQVIDYGHTVNSVYIDSDTASDASAHSVTVNAEKDGTPVVYKARYVLGCDGAHSAVRRSLGYKMVGDSSDVIWGVMDIYPQTDFPDIRKKAVLQSKAGNLMIVPREGGSLVRLYLELPKGTDAKEVKLTDIHEIARKIFHPYKLDIADTFWWSAYSIGQRLTNHFSKDNRVFLTGDACHTHSPKAGQGMNVSLQDGYNIGWKLALILKGQAKPELIKTYNIDRERIAAELIDFDRTLTKAFSSKSNLDNDAIKDALFTKSGQYTAGLATKYDQSVITRPELSSQDLAQHIIVGMRFPSAQVVRFCDARALQLLTALPADGRWRIVLFAGEIGDTRALPSLQKLAEFLSSADGPVSTFNLKNGDIDSFIEPLVVLRGNRQDLQQSDIPDYFWPVTGKWKMRDLHKVFIDEKSYNSGHGNAYAFYGVDPQVGALVVVRPDQYVSLVTKTDDFQAIETLFSDFAIKQV